MKTFSKETVAFLMENQFRDSKDWFLEHKGEYESLVMEPFRELVTALIPTMLTIDPEFLTGPKPDRLISRIYRDTRFAKDKSAFKDHMWLIFARDKKVYYGSPSFFFEITPDWYHYGCGYYQASPAEMDAMRSLILEEAPSFLAAKAAYERQNVFRMEGDRYKRSRYPEEPEDRQDWLNRKNIFFTHRSTDFGLLFSDRLTETLARDFLLLKPIYQFFLDSHARKKRDL